MPVRVARAEAPRAYEDFLLPKWKGKMWLNEDDIEWYATSVRDHGQGKGSQFMRRLAQQDLRLLAETPSWLSNSCAPANFR